MPGAHHPTSVWLSRCRTELSALIPFCAPALYGSITPSELHAWAEGIWRTNDKASCPEMAAHRAMVQMLAVCRAQASRH